MPPKGSEIWAALSTPDVLVGSVAAVTYAGAAARVIWVVGAQKVVPDLSTALRRAEEHCLRWKTSAP